MINRTYVKLEELICYFLEELKIIILGKWGIAPQQIVLGRPVKFSVNENDNNLANKRLLLSFKMAGFSDITQLEEPVAASLCFEEYFSKRDKTFLIIDLGGGTSDFSLIRRDFQKSGIDKYTVESIDGINLGGDNFDEEIMYSCLSPVLGINSTFESFDKKLPMPVHIYKDVCKWNSMHLIDKKNLSDEFRDYLYKSSDPLAVHRLRAIIENNLSHQLLGKVRSCKHELSKKDRSDIHYNELDLGIRSSVSRNELSDILSGAVDSVLDILEKTIGGSSKLATVDRFILTGGSSRVHYIGERISELTGQDKILMDKNFYDSVSRGLSLYAYYNNISIIKQ